MSFKNFSLSENIVKALNDEGYTAPTPIQEKVIPAILDDRNVMAAAQTGTGKTAGFTLPILEKLYQGEKAKPGTVRALILTPTRELAAQVHDSVKTYGKYLSVSTAAVYGGVKINPQINALRKGVDILVATPGRLLDLVQQRAVQFDQVSIFVLDEADRMLDMGFIHDIKKIMVLLPKKRQTLLFSATFSHEIRELAKKLMPNALEISVTPANSTVKAVKQIVHPVDKKKKNELLSYLIWENKWEQVLVFARTKWGANKLAEYLITEGMEAAAIHGNKSQGARTRALADFKNGEIRVLVATDIAARGLDIELLPHVVNFDLPQVAEDYVHRIGRTGRAGASGEAITLLSADEFRQMMEIERIIKQKIERKMIEGFEPEHTVPDRSHKEPSENTRSQRALPRKTDRFEKREPNKRSSYPKRAGSERSDERFDRRKDSRAGSKERGFDGKKSYREDASEKRKPFSKPTYAKRTDSDRSDERFDRRKDSREGSKERSFEGKKSYREDASEKRKPFSKPTYAKRVGSERSDDRFDRRKDSREGSKERSFEGKKSYREDASEKRKPFSKPTYAKRVGSERSDERFDRRKDSREGSKERSFEGKKSYREDFSEKRKPFSKPTYTKRVGSERSDERFDRRKDSREGSKERSFEGKKSYREDFSEKRKPFSKPTYTKRVGSDRSEDRFERRKDSRDENKERSFDRKKSYREDFSEERTSFPKKRFDNENGDRKEKRSSKTPFSKDRKPLNEFGGSKQGKRFERKEDDRKSTGRGRGAASKPFPGKGSSKPKRREW